MDWWRKIWEAFKKVDEGKYLGMISIICWCIWKRRNPGIFENKNPDPLLTIREIKRLSGDLEILKTNRNDIANGSEESAANKWSKPPPASFKVNCDASWNKETKEATCAAVVRNSSGKMIDGRVQKVLCRSSHVAEMLAIRLGVNLLKSMEASRVGSSSNLIQRKVLTLSSTAILQLNGNYPHWPKISGF